MQLEFGAMPPEISVPDPLARVRAVLADRYTIGRELGRGGMGIVLLAQDEKHHRQVAIKVLKPELGAALGRERFLREIETAAGLSHPHILPLHDSGEADGFLYYVIPYVEGESLRERLDRERQLVLEDAFQIAREVADALNYAHSHNVLHRDIKPENILLSAGHALVTDFGIARAITAGSGGQLTDVGTLVGTPAYMSPEQIDGSQYIDGRADIYSLGCVLYEMLVGEPPFRGSTLTAVIANRLSSSTPSPRLFRELVPEAVDAAVRKAMASLPADRFSTAAQFAEALGTARPSVPTPAVPDRSIAVLPFKNQSSDPESEYFSDGIAEEIINALAQLPGLQVAARTSSFAFKGKSVDIAEVGAKLKVATVLDGSVRKAGNRVRITAQLVNVGDGYYLWSERYDSELDDVFAIQDHIARAIAQRFEVMLASPTGRFAQQMAAAR
jgi:eukaryotic-like serine/threonine-protein kinase